MVPWEFLFKETPGKSSDALEFRRRRSDSWDPQARHPNFRGEALDLDPPQGQPPHRHRFLGCKNHRFFAWEKVYQNPAGVEKTPSTSWWSCDRGGRSYTKDYEFHGPLFAGKGCGEKNWDFENSIKKTRLKTPWKKGAKKKPLEIWHTQVN